MIYNDLKGKVTHFSSQLKLEPKNILDVQVGGKIKEIYEPLNLFIEPFEIESTNEKCEGVDFREYYTLLIDDGLGELVVYASKELYENKKEYIQVNNICVFRGMTNTLSRKIGKEYDVEVRVFAYDIEKISIKEAVI